MRTLLASAVLWIAACGGDSSPTTGAATCKTTGECRTGQFCNSAGFCQAGQGCTTDAQCPHGQTCDSTSAACLCSADTQCGLGQSCNAQGACEANTSCSSNGDCPTGQFCDTMSQGCIPQGSCTQDLQCPQGQICTNSTCQQGCTVDGDCTLVDYSQTPPVVEPAACLNFVCVPNGCLTTADCPIFSKCITGQPGGGGTCQTVCGQTEFCQGCDPTDPNACGGSGICLIDPRDQASCQGPGGGCLYFCGLDCSNGQSCPAGTVCNEIIAVGQQGTDGPGETCNVGDTCTGQMDTPCPVEEGAQSGACPCYFDSDCPVDENGNSLSCTNGACVIGATCGPLKQYTCSTQSCGAG